MRFTYHTPLVIFGIFGLCALLFLSGCQHQKNAIRELERENRALEDALYQMKFQTESACRYASRTSEENERLRARLENSSGSNGTSDFNRLRESIQELGNPALSSSSVMTPTVAPSGHTVSFTTPAVRPTSVELPMTQSFQYTPNTQSPSISQNAPNTIPNTQTAPNPQRSQSSPTPLNNQRSQNIPNAQTPAYSAVTPVSASLPVREVPATTPPAATQQSQTTTDRRAIEQIVINPTMTTSWRSGQNCGIRVFIEPRDAVGNTQRTTGEISVSLVDPEISTSQGYCGLWTLSAQQTAAQWTQTEVGDGWFFEFPLPQTPRHQNLTLFVRLTESNGRRLETRQTLVFPIDSSLTTNVPTSSVTPPPTVLAYSPQPSPVYTPTTTPTIANNPPNSIGATTVDAATTVTNAPNAATTVGAIPRRNISLQKQRNAW